MHLNTFLLVLYMGILCKDYLIFLGKICRYLNCSIDNIISLLPPPIGNEILFFSTKGCHASTHYYILPWRTYINNIIKLLLSWTSYMILSWKNYINNITKLLLLNTFDLNGTCIWCLGRQYSTFDINDLGRQYYK